MSRSRLEFGGCQILLGHLTNLSKASPVYTNVTWCVGSREECLMSNLVLMHSDDDEHNTYIDLGLLYQLPLVSEKYKIEVWQKTSSKTTDICLGTCSVNITELRGKYDQLNYRGGVVRESFILSETNGGYSEPGRKVKLECNIKLTVAGVRAAAVSQFNGEFAPLTDSRSKGLIPYADSRGRGELQKQIIVRLAWPCPTDEPKLDNGISVEMLELPTPRDVESDRSNRSRLNRSLKYQRNIGLSKDEIVQELGNQRPCDIRIPVYVTDGMDMEPDHFKDDSAKYSKSRQHTLRNSRLNTFFKKILRKEVF